MVEHLITPMGARSYSAALCMMINTYINGLDEDLTRKLRFDIRAAMIEEDIQEGRSQKPDETSRIGVCPSCGDTQNVVNYPSGKWRCNLCLEEGQV